MNFFSRHKNTVVLAMVLLAQFLALAVQVKRQTVEGPVRLIRLLAVEGITPFERLFIYSGENMRGIWTNYIDLRNVRSENLRLRAEAGQMRLERAREQEDARQARRIQALLEFKEHWIDTTVAAQVIGTSGTETSRLLYIDKGTKEGIKPDMPVITPDGVIGKVLSVYGETSQVLLINDPSSGVGAILVNSRLQGVVKGSSTGEVQLNYIMGDETVQPGEALVTAGGDRVFPKGLPIGTVAKVSMGRNLFLDIKLKPSADLDRLEEVLVITSQKSRAPDTAGLGPIRASDILAGHLPGVPQPSPQTQPHPAGQTLPQPPVAGSQPPAKPDVAPNAKPALAVGNVPAHAGSQNTSITKPQSSVPMAGANAAKPQNSVPAAGVVPAKPLQSAKPAGSNAGASTAVAKPAPKLAPQKPVSPNTPVPSGKAKSAATQGTQPQ